MSDFSSLTPFPLPESIPVFPLPETVFFPRTVLPLHVFEERYRKMVKDAMSGDRLIAVALLKPDWEPEYYESPEVYPLACAGVMDEVVELPDHRYNIKLSGVCRVRIESFEREKPYRVARVTVVPERVPDDEARGVEEAKLGLIGAWALMAGEEAGQSASVLRNATEVPLQLLVNTFCGQIDLSVDQKQRLLAIDDVLERGLVLTDLILKESERLRRERLEESELDGEGGDGDETVH